MRKAWIAVGVIASGLATAPGLSAQAVRSGFDANALTACDDCTSGKITLPFMIRFFGSSSDSAFINNNGMLDLDHNYNSWTPSDLLAFGDRALAPLWSDLDTRNAATSPVTYGSGTVNGHTAFGVNWLGVGEYSNGGPTNIFQLMLIDRSDIGIGDFDFEFNYGAVGIFHHNPRAGYSAGPGLGYELPGSGSAAALDDGGVNSLSGHSAGSAVTGRYLFEARTVGDVTTVTALQGIPTTTTPEPVSMALLGTGLVGVVGAARRRRRQTDAA